MANSITLSDLSKKKEEEKKNEVISNEEITNVKKEIENITPQDRERINEIKENIDIMDSSSTIQYGSAAQKNIASFSETILGTIKSKDAGQVGDIMTDLMVKIKDVERGEEGESFISKIPLIGKLARQTEKKIIAHQDLETQVSKIESDLDKARMGLLKDIGVMDNLYQKNVEFFNDLQLYIYAGEEKLDELRNETIPSLRMEAAQSNDPMASQLVNDFESTVNRFEKKVHDLKLSKTIAIQTAPQIKLIQNNDKQLVEKIQTAIFNTIPLWKSQMVISLGLSKQQGALRMQQMVSQTTNELLQKNSEMLKSNSIEVAKETERGVVEIETLKKVNENLLTTIEETLKIQKEGQQKRLQAEQELIKIEDTLKQALLKAVNPTKTSTVSDKALTENESFIKSEGVVKDATFIE